MMRINMLAQFARDYTFGCGPCCYVPATDKTWQADILACDDVSVTKWFRERFNAKK